MSPKPFNANAAFVRGACQQSDMHRALALCRILYTCNEDLPDLPSDAYGMDLIFFSC